MNGFSTGPIGISPLGSDLFLLASCLQAELVSLIALDVSISPASPQVN
jgi:hypothetical protein